MSSPQPTTDASPQPQGDAEVRGKSVKKVLKKRVKKEDSTNNNHDESMNSSTMQSPAANGDGTGASSPSSPQGQSQNNNEADQDQQSPEGSMNESERRGSSSSPGKVKHGRRCLRVGEHANVPAARKGWGGGGDGDQQQASNLEGHQSQQVASFQGEADAATLKAIEKSNQDAMAAHEQLVSEVAQAATEFHSAMPKQSDLERATAAKFQNLLSQASQEGVDLQCLMATLTGQFDDEDVSWDQDHLLMQLTSEINDRLGGAGEDEEFDINMQYGYGYHDGTGVQSTAQQQQQQSSSGGGGGRDRSGAFGSSHNLQQQESVSNNNNENTGAAVEQNNNNISPANNNGGDDQTTAPAHGRRRRG